MFRQLQNSSCLGSLIPFIYCDDKTSLLYWSGLIRLKDQGNDKYKDYIDKSVYPLIDNK